MHIGVTAFLTDQTIDPITLARAAEERGYYSLYVPEHTHIPITRRTPPPTGDKELREEYKRTLDPFVALTAAAAVTTRLRVGTGIALVAQREPIVTAKTIATLDVLSNGRFDFGVGYGWNEDEMENHGIVPRERRALSRDHLLAMQRLWKDEIASYEGEHVKLAPSWMWPKPHQKPWPPILFGGGAGPKLFDAIAELGDGWIPIGGAGVAAALPELNRAFEARGRDPKALRVVLFGTIPDRGKLDYYASIGVTEVVLRLPAASRDEVLPILDRYVEFIGATAEK